MAGVNVEKKEVKATFYKRIYLCEQCNEKMVFTGQVNLTYPTQSVFRCKNGHTGSAMSHEDIETHYSFIQKNKENEPDKSYKGRNGWES